MHQVRQVLTFLLIGIVIAHLLRFAVDRLDPSQIWWHFERLNVRKVLAEDTLTFVEVLAVGNSHAGNFDYDAMSVDGVTINRAGGDPKETRMSLSHWVPRAPRVSTVLYAASPYIFHSDNGATETSRDNRILFYTNNPIWQPIAGDHVNFVLGKSQIVFPHLQIVRSDSWRIPIISLASLLLSPHSSSVTDQRTVGTSSESDVDSKRCPARSRDELATLSAARVASHKELVDTSDLDRVAEQYAVLEETSQFLASRGIRLIFVTPPYHSTFNSEFMRVMPETVQQMRTLMHRLVREGSAEYYDYSDDLRWSEDDSVFGDTDHLNACGVESFSRALAEELGLNPSR